MANYPSRWTDCTESVSGHDVGGTTNGTCAWCGKKVDFQPRPSLPADYRTEQDTAYRRMYDPDYGNDPFDI